MADRSLLEILRVEMHRSRDALARLGAVFSQVTEERKAESRSERDRQHHVERMLDQLDRRQVEMLALLADVRRRLPEAPGEPPGTANSADAAAGAPDPEPSKASRRRGGAASRRRPLHAPGH